MTQFTPIAFLIGLLILNNASALQDACYGLVLEGGGDLGAFEAGVIQGLAAHLPGKEAQWDVVGGVSVGALTSAAVAQYPQGQETAMASWLTNLWENITSDDVYKNWPLGILDGLLYQPGIFDTTPLKAFVKANINGPPQRALSILSCDANTGLFHRFDETLSIADIQEAVVSSAAVPILFPYQKFEHSQLFDGGVCKMTDISGVIQKCRKLVDSDSKIHLHMVYIANRTLEAWTGGETSFEAYSRYNKIEAFRKNFRELIVAQDFYPDVNYDYIVAPTQTLPGAKFPFTFKKEQLTEMIARGNADAAAAVKLGPGVSVQNFLIQAEEQNNRDHDTHPDEMNVLRYKHARNVKMARSQQTVTEI